MIYNYCCKKPSSIRINSMKKLLTVLTFSIFCIAFADMASAQTGTLEGTVRTADGELLPGVTVQIVGQTIGRSTNSRGYFQFSSLSAGNYTLSVRFIGYETSEVDVQVNAGEITSVSIELVESQLMLDDLLVTAQKRAQSIQQVPITISSLTGDFLTQTNIQEFDLFSAYVPGLEVQIQSVNNPGFVVRGITSDSGDSRIEPRVSVFQDGVSISKSRGSIVELYDLERVEVLKGPQGTLFGRGAQIGAVHIIQNKPNNQFSGELTVGGGSENERLLKGYINTPIVDQKLFARVAGLYNARDGFIENLSGGNLNGKDTFALRGSIRYLPTENTIIDLITNYQKDTPPGTSFKSGTYAPANGSLDPNAFADLERGEDLFIDRTVWGTTLLVSQGIGDGFSLNSTTAYREFDSLESFDADGTIAPVLWFAEDAYGEQFSQEFRLNYDQGGRFKGFTGVSYFWEDGYQRVPFETDERSYWALLTPFLGGIGVPFEPLVFPDGTPNLRVETNPITGVPHKTFHEEQYTNFGTQSAYEAFVDGSYQLTDKLGITAGLRFSYEDVTGAYDVPVAPVPGTLGFVLGTGPNNLFAPTDGKQSRSETFTSLIGRLIANYEFSPQTNVFSSFSRGRRPNVINVNASGSRVLDNEIVLSYEAGLKQLAFNNRFSFDFSAFYYDYTNFQTSIAELTEDGLVIETRDTGEATAFGFETSTRFNLNRNISLFGNYGYVNATIDDTDTDGNEQELAGNRFRLTPKHSYSLGFNLIQPVGNDASLFIRPSFVWKSQVYFEEDNEPGIEQGAYGLLNLRAGLELFNNNFEIAIYGKNLLNEEYIIDAGNTGGAFGIPTFIAGQPRVAGVQLTGRF